MKNIKQFESYSDSDYEDSVRRGGRRSYNEMWREKISPEVKNLVDQMLEGSKKKSGGEPSDEDKLTIQKAVELLTGQNAMEILGVHVYLKDLNPDYGKNFPTGLSQEEMKNNPVIKALHMLKPYIEEFKQKYPDQRSMDFDFFPQKKMF